MKIISYSRNGRVQKIRKTNRRSRPCKVRWGAVEVPRDRGGFIARPYPDEIPGFKMRKYRASSGEGKIKGIRIPYVRPNLDKPKQPVRVGITNRKRKKPVTRPAYSVAQLVKGHTA